MPKLCSNEKGSSFLTQCVFNLVISVAYLLYLLPYTMSAKLIWIAYYSEMNEGEGSKGRTGKGRGGDGTAGEGRTGVGRVGEGNK